MIYDIDETHDPELESWLDSANDPATDFPIQNLPLGLFLREDEEVAAIGVAIGDQVLDLGLLAETLWEDAFFEDMAEACLADSLDVIMSFPPDESRQFRRILSRLLSASADDEERDFVAGCLLPQKGLEMLLPVPIGNYTDFYASIHHATNIGRMFRPDQPLLPNYKWIPIGYHGRASSIVPGETPIRRPMGQTMPEVATAPVFGPSRALDFELEVGAFVRYGNLQGRPIDIEEAEEHLFGLALVNDWSARDIQRWEYQPLGPFLSKSFATSISPWIVTMEALAPFRAPAFAREADDPDPLPYLDSADNRARGGFDIRLEALFSSSQMREKGMPALRICESNTQHLYWTFAQMLTHHASNGCNLEPGDLLASGTVSGPTPDSLGSLIEITQRGASPLQLPTGESRRFLEDGDEIVLRASCQRDGFRRIGFGSCAGRVTSNP